MSKPIIAVSINYRLNGFGFLGGPDVREKGLGNLGYRDQRLALHWIQVCPFLRSRLYAFKAKQFYYRRISSSSVEILRKSLFGVSQLVDLVLARIY